MKKFFKISFEIISDVVCAIAYFIVSNLRNFAWLLNLLLPYLMYFIGQFVRNERGRLQLGSELFIPILVCVVIYYIKSYANKIGKGSTVPVPEKRFTEIDSFGEVSVRNDRIQELLLYLADLEDWMERRNML